MAKKPQSIQKSAPVKAAAKPAAKTPAAAKSADVTAIFSQGKAAAEKFLGDSQVRFDAALKQFGGLTDAAPRAAKAVVEASNTAVKGIETVGAETVAFSKARIGTAVEATKKLASLRSLPEVVDLQTAYAKDAFKAYADYARKIAELSQKTAQDSAAPIAAEARAFYASVAGRAAA